MLFFKYWFAQRALRGFIFFKYWFAQRALRGFIFSSTGSPNGPGGFFFKHWSAQPVWFAEDPKP